MVKSIAESIDPKLFPEIWLLKAAVHQNMLNFELAAAAASMLGIAAALLAAMGLLGLVGLYGFGTNEGDRDPDYTGSEGGSRIVRDSAAVRVPDRYWPPDWSGWNCLSLAGDTQSAVRRQQLGSTQLRGRDGCIAGDHHDGGAVAGETGIAC